MLNLCNGRFSVPGECRTPCGSDEILLEVRCSHPRETVPLRCYHIAMTNVVDVAAITRVVVVVSVSECASKYKKSELVF